MPVLSSLSSMFRRNARQMPVVRTLLLTVSNERLDAVGRDMRGVDLRALRGRLCEADFRGANFSGMDLRGLDFTGARFCGANLDGTITDETTNFKKANFCRLEFFDLERLGLELRDAFDRRPARLTNGSHIGTRFQNAQLNDIILDGSDISRARVTDVNIAGASMQGTICRGTDFTGTYTCLVNGNGEIGPRLKPASSELRGAIVDETTIFDPKPYSKKVDADANGDFSVRAGPGIVHFRSFGGSMS